MIELKDLKYVIPPVNTDYLKKGKKYPVKEARELGFTIAKSDLDHSAESDLCGLYKGCSHLLGRDWILEYEKSNKV